MDPRHSGLLMARSIPRELRDGGRAELAEVNRAVPTRNRRIAARRWRGSTPKGLRKDLEDIPLQSTRLCFTHHSIQNSRERRNNGTNTIPITLALSIKIKIQLGRLGLEKVGLRERPKRINHFNNRIFPSINKSPGNHPLSRAVEFNWCRHFSTTLTEHYHGFPARIEDLHEGGIIWHRNPIKFFISSTYIASRWPCSLGMMANRRPRAACSDALLIFTVVPTH